MTLKTISPMDGRNGEVIHQYHVYHVYQPVSDAYISICLLRDSRSLNRIWVRKRTVFSLATRINGGGRVDNNASIARNSTPRPSGDCHTAFTIISYPRPAHIRCHRGYTTRRGFLTDSNRPNPNGIVTGHGWSPTSKLAEWSRRPAAIRGATPLRQIIGGSRGVRAFDDIQIDLLIISLPLGFKSPFLKVYSSLEIHVFIPLFLTHPDLDCSNSQLCSYIIENAREIIL